MRSSARRWAVPVGTVVLGLVLAGCGGGAGTGSSASSASAAPRAGSPAARPGEGGASGVASASPSPSVAPTPVPPAAPGARVAQLGGQVAAYAASRSAVVSVAVYDRRTGLTLVVNPAARVDTASIVKLQMLEQLLAGAQAQGRPLTPAEQTLATSMIRISDDRAMGVLWRRTGAGPSLERFGTRLGLTATDPGAGGWWGWTRTSAVDQLKVAAAVAYPNPVLSDASRATAVSLLARVVPSQRWGAPTAAGASAWVKVGWMPSGRNFDSGWRINSVGHVRGPGRDYVVAILTAESRTKAAGVAVVNRIGQLVYAQLASAATASPVAPSTPASLPPVPLG